MNKGYGFTKYNSKALFLEFGRIDSSPAGKCIGESMIKFGVVGRGYKLFDAFYQYYSSQEFVFKMLYLTIPCKVLINYYTKEYNFIIYLLVLFFDH